MNRSAVVRGTLLAAAVVVATLLITLVLVAMVSAPAGAEPIAAAEWPALIYRMLTP